MNNNNTTNMTTIDTAIVSYLNDYHDVNRLFYKGSLFNPYNKSYYGYKIDVLKSALQKYLRRKELKKMEWVITELYMFRFADSRAIGVLSNVLNRIKIFNDEEMCFDDWNRYLKVHELIEEFEKNDKVGLNILLKICRILVDCNMIRLSSDVKNYYKLAIDKYSLKLEDAEVNQGKVLRYVKEGDDKECLDLFGKFIDLFEKGSEDCCYYALKLMNKEENKVKCGRRIRRTGPSYMVWDYLLSIGRKKNNENCMKLLEYRLREYHTKRGERHIFMTASIYMMIYYDEMEWDKVIDYSKYDVSDQEIINMLNERVKLDIDDYCIDMHCSEGRKKGKNKRDFVLEGSVVVDEYTKYSRPEMRKFYIELGLDHAKKVESGELPAKGRRGKKKKSIKDMLVKKENNKKERKEIKIQDKIEKKEIKKEKKESKMTDRAKLRSEKYKKIKKMRGVPNFDDLEKDLEFIDGKKVDVNYIELCSDTTCGNKVMCFRFITMGYCDVPNTVWKESRKSMNYNRDYCVLDECKEMFGLKKIGMKRVLSNFRIEKIDKDKKSWKDNWRKVYTENEKVVYCVMDCIYPGVEIGKAKEMLKDRKMLKEFVKIGVFRGIFRASDFNGRNVLINEIRNEIKLVSIDEGDIGKRLDIIGGREKWLINALNKDKSIINEIINEVNAVSPLYVVNKMKKYKFSDDLCKEVINNWNNLRKDLESEGVEF